jgi:hypothetical protein
MKRAGELRQQAERYKRLKRQIGDAAALKAVTDLEAKYEMTATELEKRHQTRERAHEIWIERGRPEGRDVEFWLQAERELSSHPGRSLVSPGLAARHRKGP